MEKLKNTSQQIGIFSIANKQYCQKDRILQYWKTSLQIIQGFGIETIVTDFYFAFFGSLRSQIFRQVFDTLSQLKCFIVEC